MKLEDVSIEKCLLFCLDFFLIFLSPSALVPVKVLENLMNKINVFTIAEKDNDLFTLM